MIFAAHGDPGWPAYERDGRITARLAEQIVAVEDLCGAERRAWEQAP